MDILNYIKENTPHLLLNDPETLYKCSATTECGNFSFLHKLVMLTRKHKKLEDYLKIYLQTEKGKNELNSRNSLGWTPLMLACCNSNTDSTLRTVKILMKNQADPNSQTNSGETPLMFACRYSGTDSSVETVKLLVENKADLNLQEYIAGYTALMMSYRYLDTSSLESVTILTKKGANLDIQNKFGQTALIMALNVDRFYVIRSTRILIENHANLNLQTRNGYNAFMYLLKSKFMRFYIDYYYTQDKNIIEKFISEHKIPIGNYDLLVDLNIISPILPNMYEESKHHMQPSNQIYQNYELRYA